MIERGDAVPHFNVRGLTGQPLSYAAVWQRSNLLLVATPHTDDQSMRQFVSQLTARASELSALQTELVATRDVIAGLPQGGVLIADRWGEIVHVVHASAPDDLPTVDDLLDWLEHLQSRCPECEGETK